MPLHATSTNNGLRAASVLAGFAAFLSASGCGGWEQASYAEPQTFDLAWREVADVQQGRLVFEVDRVVVREHGWSVDASIANRTNVTYIITRPHVRGGTKTGLVVGKATLVANRFDPALPRVLGPSKTWKGRFSGTRRIPRDTSVRVSFGVFFNGAARPLYFRWVTDHSFRL